MKKTRDLWDDEPSFMVKVFRNIRRRVKFNSTNLSKLKNLLKSSRYCYYLFDFEVELFSEMWGRFQDSKELEAIVSFIESIETPSRFAINKFLIITHPINGKLEDKLAYCIELFKRIPDFKNIVVYSDIYIN